MSAVLKSFVMTTIGVASLGCGGFFFVGAGFAFWHSFAGSEDFVFIQVGTLTIDGWRFYLANGLLLLVGLDFLAAGVVSFQASRNES